MPFTVLSVAYPLTPVGPDAVGGSEQILTSLDIALTEAGHRSLVVACEGSETAGELVATPRWDGELNEEVRRWAQTQHYIAIRQALEKYHVDFIHMHSLDWHQYTPDPGIPLLATLHLPPDWYPDFIYDWDRPRTYLNCVSQAQLAAAPGGPVPKFVVENGVPISRLRTHVNKRNYVLALGRVCPEKGLHIALDAARRADVPMILSGGVYKYESHVQYFEHEIKPRLNGRRKFTGPAGLDRKRRLMAGAKCLLVPSLVAETSSLVTMEAFACGTPVIAFNTGALPEIVDHGLTGFIVNSEEEMAAAIGRVGEIDREECRRVARVRFSAARMARDYMALYERLTQQASASLPVTSASVPQPSK
jgi:glycosyltransferase involved in cell wall biosynthesis